MALITRCPVCGTLFKVVPDQLRISEGWVRCGHCAEIFDASGDLQQSSAEPLEVQSVGSLPESLPEVRPPAPPPAEPLPEPATQSGPVQAAPDESIPPVEVEPEIVLLAEQAALEPSASLAVPAAGDVPDGPAVCLLNRRTAVAILLPVNRLLSPRCRARFCAESGRRSRCCWSWPWACKVFSKDVTVWQRPGLRPDPGCRRHVSGWGVRYRPCGGSRRLLLIARP